MARWESGSGVRPDKPKKHTPAFGGGGTVDDAFAQDYSDLPARDGLNAQSHPAELNQARRKRLSWLRSNLSGPSADGHTPERADFDALPEAHRDQARRVCQEAKELHREGNRAEAWEHAREGMLALEREIGHGWKPPALEAPSSELIDVITGRDL